MDFNLIVADPDPLARTFLIDALSKRDLVAAAEAQTIADAVDAARNHYSRLIILAAVFPGLATTSEAIREVHRSSPATAVVITELPGADLDPVAVFQAGAAGFVIKDADIGHWLPPMLYRYARDGVAPLSPGVSQEVIRELQGVRTMADADRATVSDREIEVMRLVSRGLNNQEIAQALGVGTSTVKTHIRNLLRKLQLANRVMLALYARRQSDNADRD